MPVPSPYAQQLAAIPVSRRVVTVAGSDTVFWEYGPADAPLTILAVHGFRGDHHGLEPIVAHMPDVRWIMPDLPGFGETGRLNRPHDLAAFTAWLREFAASVAPGAVILGHSFGSIVVAAAVVEGLPTPRVVLVNPIGAPALQGPRAVLTRLAQFYYWASANLPPRIGTWLLRSRLIVRVMSVAMAKTRDAGLRRWIHNQHDRFFSGFADRASLHEAFVTSVSHDVRAYAPEMPQPTMLVAAVRDDITPIAAERRLATMFPDATLVEIDDVGHLIHYEKPAEAAAAIRDFLA
ncbi:alpha/beta fold hydrolase [Microbacterium amylolyticum]|uniref:Pimeloyl-ACP methyl ester carboxylesterase n=1 Tax=Microbacterium amylolyticum TaxID=936337 RepID=A0ABS4ZEW4_9MICO|nr:alpha/beta hydrolase [Microbacterium amylolyticum]MBP2435830.1 pimeloyl-ACP methyl ester carboxylesterase [Microbacterium amylolyticum]